MVWGVAAGFVVGRCIFYFGVIAEPDGTKGLLGSRKTFETQRIYPGLEDTVLAESSRSPKAMTEPLRFAP